MAIKIERIHNQAYKVNGKAIMQNEIGNWVSPFHTLIDEEWEAFLAHIKKNKQNE